MTTRYFSSLIEQSLSRSTEATLSIMGVTNPNLREHLTQQMAADCGKEGSFLASPVFEQTFGWKEFNSTMKDLATKQTLLSKEVWTRWIVRKMVVIVLALTGNLSRIS